MRKTILRVMYSAALAAIICIGCGGDDGGQTNSLKVSDLLNAITGSGKDASATPKYNVYFNPNGAVGIPPGTIQRDSGVTLTLPDQAGLVKDGHSFAGWYENRDGNEINYNANTSYTVTRTTTLFAKWTRNTYTLTINAATGGTTSRNPNQTTYNAGTEVVVTATAAQGYTFIGWSGASGSASPTVTITMNDDKTLTPVFGKAGAKRFTVTFNGNGAMAGSAPTAITADSGATITLPDQGSLDRSKYSFSGWNTNNIGTGTDYTVNSRYIVKGDVTLYAKWTANTYTLTIIANPSGGGSLSRNPNQMSYNDKTNVAVTATPNAGYTFTGWSGAAFGAANPVTIVMDDDKTLVANFQQIPYTVTVSSTGIGASIGGSYVAGTTVTITAGNAPSDYRFKNWTTTSSGVTFANANSATTTFTMPANAVTVTANFETIYITDTRNGKTYKTVKIGSQTWMAENLNYETSSGSWCYGNDPANCVNYGRLYNWAAAMDIDQGYNSTTFNGGNGRHKGVCPTGWHLPTSAEWDALVTAAGGSSTAGKALKSTSGWNDNGNGTDNHGFSALPGGYRYSGGSFLSAGNLGYWGTATEYGSNTAYTRGMGSNYDSVFDYDYYKSSGQSVRCLED